METPGSWGTSCLELQDMGWMEEASTRSAKTSLGAEGGFSPLLPNTISEFSSLMPLVGLLSGESEKQTPSTLIPGIVLARRGRAVFNRAMLISTAPLGRKVTKQRFHFDVIKLALNK